MDNRCVRKGAISLDEVLNAIEVPSVEGPDLDTSFVSDKSKDLFAVQIEGGMERRAIGQARCDFSPNKVRISYRNPAFGFISLWKKSLYGRTLTDI